MARTFVTVWGRGDTVALPRMVEAARSDRFAWSDMLATQGVRAPDRVVPFRLAYGLGAAAERTWPLFSHREPPLSRSENVADAARLTGMCQDRRAAHRGSERGGRQHGTSERAKPTRMGIGPPADSVRVRRLAHGAAG